MIIYMDWNSTKRIPDGMMESRTFIKIGKNTLEGHHDQYRTKTLIASR